MTDEYNTLEKQLAEKYGFNEDQVKDMVNIYDQLSLKDYFKSNKELVVELLEDKGKQPIPIEKCKFEIPKEEITKLLKDGKEIKVVYKPVFIFRVLTGEFRGKTFSRIPSNSELVGLMKVEYSRRSQNNSFVGALLLIKPSTFTDKNNVEREGYSVDEITESYVTHANTSEKQQLEHKTEN